MFDIKPDLSVDVTAIVTMHPSGTWSSYSFALGTSTGATNVAAYDYLTGNQLQVGESTRTGGGTMYRVNFPGDEPEGYRCRLQFHATGMTSKTGAGFTIGYGWGGSATVTAVPQKVRVQLPAGYNVVSVINTNSSINIPYTASWDGTRIIAEFQGTAPPKGYFTWRVTASGTSSLASVTSIVNTSTVRESGASIGPYIVGTVIGAMFGAGVMFLFIDRRKGIKKIQNVIVDCPKCGAENPLGNRYCGSCATELADVTRVYDRQA
jgi:hypothetical protein